MVGGGGPQGRRGNEAAFPAEQGFAARALGGHGVRRETLPGGGRRPGWPKGEERCEPHIKA
jgi:hypothetical protein